MSPPLISPVGRQNPHKHVLGRKNGKLGSFCPERCVMNTTEVKSGIVIIGRENHFPPCLFPPARMVKIGTKERRGVHVLCPRTAVPTVQVQAVRSSHQLGCSAHWVCCRRFFISFPPWADLLLDPHSACLGGPTSVCTFRAGPADGGYLRVGVTSTSTLRHHKRQTPNGGDSFTGSSELA